MEEYFEKIKIIVAALLLPFLFSLKAHADALPSMSGDRVLDVSKYNGNINWKQVKQDKKIKTKFAIIRVQSGSRIVDEYRNQNARGLSAAKIPFGSYAYSELTSVSEAQYEARRFYSLSDKRTKFYVLDDESHIGKAKEQTYINAWLAQMRKLTKKKVIFYSYRNYIRDHKIKYSSFDGLWEACIHPWDLYYNPDLWQYSFKAKASGLAPWTTADISYMRHPSVVMSWLKPYTKIKYTKANSHAVVKQTNYKIWTHDAQPGIKSVGTTSRYALNDIKVVQKGTRADNKVGYYKIAINGKNIGWVNKTAIKLVTYQKATYSKAKSTKGWVKQPNLKVKLYNHVPKTSFSAKAISDWNQAGLGKDQQVKVSSKATRADKTKWLRIQKVGSKTRFWVPENTINFVNPVKPVTKTATKPVVKPAPKTVTPAK